MIYIGCDHAGYDIKERIKKYLAGRNIHYTDLGAFDKKNVDDYPDYAKEVALRVKKNKRSKGILVCGSGIGMVIAANRFKGIRATAPYDSYTAKMSRYDNDANIIAFRGRGFNINKIKSMLKVWLETPFSGIARHKKRIKKLDT